MFFFREKRGPKNFVREETFLLARDLPFHPKKRTGIHVVIRTPFSEPRYKLDLGSLLFFRTRDAVPKYQASLLKKAEKKQKNDGRSHNRNYRD
jgi:hypothetical protein